MPETIPAVLAGAVGRHPDRPWLRLDDRIVTFGEAGAHVARVAQRLSAAGIHAGTRVVVPMRNDPAHLLLWLALTTCGAVAVLANPASPEPELTALVEQVAPARLLTEPDVTALAGDWSDTAGELHQLPQVMAEVDETDVAVLLPTSGTTGRSKLVMQTHRAYAMAGVGFPYWLGLTGEDVLMTSLPLFHVNALAYSTLGSLAAGAGLVLLPRFSATTFLDAARAHGATQFNAIGAMLEFLARRPERPDDADNPLRRCYVGPTPTRERQLYFEERFGFRLVCGYGLSESTYGLIWPPGARPYETMGVPRQHPTLGRVNEARVVDEAGRDVATGQTGELLLRNPTVTPGYWGMPDETARTIVDGWLHTGDIVTANADGTFSFVRRAKDVIRRRGENLAPAEVEAAIEQCPDVQEAAVVAVPSDVTDEEVKAFVVPRAGARLDVAALGAFVAHRLARFKVPRYWEVTDELPRTPTARVAKHLLPRELTGREHDLEPPARTEHP